VEKTSRVGKCILLGALWRTGGFIEVAVLLEWESVGKKSPRSARGRAGVGLSIGGRKKCAASREKHLCEMYRTFKNNGSKEERLKSRYKATCLSSELKRRRGRELLDCAGKPGSPKG